MIDAEYALRYYKSTCRTLDDVEEDFARIKWIKRLINNYKRGKELNERLLLNHFIIWFNVFVYEAAVVMLFRCIPESDWDVVITFLDFLDYTPLIIPELGIPTADIDRDEVVLRALNAL